MAWRVVAASATGRAHLDRGQPCQDAFASASAGDLLVAAVCDGAGSAMHSDVGARQVADGVVQTLVRVLQAGPRPLELAVDVLRPLIEQAVNDVRGELAMASVANGVGFSEHACTLVGVAADATGGWFFHVGDGVAACRFGGQQASAVSLPANGEYANETWFVTGDNWQQQLRLMRFEGPVDAIALMSDGVQPFAMTRDGADMFQPFFEPVVRYLRGVDANTGSQALHATLADPRTDHITGDDKTLLLALPV